MEEAISIIKNNILFEGMNDLEIKKLLKCANCQIISYEQGQTVFVKDDLINRMGIVLSGEFNLVAQKYNGTRAIITTLENNDIFGEALIFASDKKAPYDLVSFSNSKAILIPYSIFFSMCHELCSFHERLILNLLTILSDKIVMLNNKMNILNADTLRNRIAVYLINVHKKTNTLTFNIPMKRQELADFLNVSRPSLSREMSFMQKDKIIDMYRSSIKILDLDRLYELAE